MGRSFLARVTPWRPSRLYTVAAAFCIGTTDELVGGDTTVKRMGVGRGPDPVSGAVSVVFRESMSKVQSSPAESAFEAGPSKERVMTRQDWGSYPVRVSRSLGLARERRKVSESRLMELSRKEVVSRDTR